MGADKNISQAHVVVAATGTTTSRAMRSALLDNYSFQGVWTGSTPVGTLDVQVSNDHQETGGVVTNAGTWTSIYAGGTVPAISGNSGNLFINVAAISAAFVRCVFTKTSGTFTAMDVYFNGRSI